jgi:hypothetical protein
MKSGDLKLTFKQTFGAITQIIFVTLRILILNLLFQRYGNVLGGLKDTGFDSGRGKIFSLLQNVGTSPVAHTYSLVVGTHFLFKGFKPARA